MSQPRHTPGPWTAYAPPNMIHLRDILNHGTNGPKVVARGVDAESACLIAAAPEMLDALKLILSDNRLMNAMKPAQARAILDAVARAEGGAE